MMSRADDRGISVNASVLRTLCLLVLLGVVRSPLAGAAEAVDALPAAEDMAHFDIWEYRVLGNSVLASRDLEALLYPMLGEDKTLSDVERVRVELETLYRNRGFGTIFVDIPEQDVTGGVVRLKVTEGKLERVRVTGARYFSNGQLRAEVPELQPGKVLALPELQQQLAQANSRTADRQVTPVLKAGSAPGLVAVELKVQDTLPFHASAEVNNQYTADTTELRARVTVGFDNLFQLYHRLSIQYQDSPEEPGESRSIAATYVAPLPGTNGMLAAFAVDTNSDFATAGDIGTLSVLGAGRLYGLRYIAPLPSDARYSHSLSFGVTYKDFQDSIFQPTGDPDVTPAQYLTWNAQYAGTLRTEHSATSFTFGPTIGLRGLANQPAEFEFKRYKARANFFYLRADAQHDHRLPLQASLFLRAEAQLTDAPLISNEEFAAGGAASVRGYLESEILGDNGFVGSVELRSPSLNRWLPGMAQLSYLALFLDGGVVGILEPLPINGVTTHHRSIASWGAGLHFAGWGGLQADLDWAYPLKATEDIARGDSRIHFRLSYGF